MALKTLTSMIQSLFEICEKEYPLLKNVNNNDINIEQTINSEDMNFIKDNIQETNISEINEKIDNNLKKKYELQTAAEKFNYKIKSGIAY